MSKKVLVFEWESFGMSDVILTFEKLGYEVETFTHPDIFAHESKDFRKAFNDITDRIRQNYVFSLNFYPILSNACEKRGIPYVSIVYDCPQIALYSCAVINSCNHIFLFDKTWYQEMKKGGITTVHYTVLPVNIERYRRKVAMPLPLDVKEKLSSEISFVGSLYNEKHNLYDKLVGIDEYTAGFLESMIEAQQKIQGYYLVEDTMTDRVLAELERVCPFKPAADSVATSRYVYAHYFLGRKITQIERTHYLQEISARWNLKLFTHQSTPDIPDAINLGPVDYYEVMPHIFHLSKINLNITLRSIRSGIPLRALDIMASGGFLLSNYQEDFLEYFEPDRDFVYYVCLEDLLEKIQFYLENDELREHIAKNGNRRVAEVCDYCSILRDIMSRI